MVEMKILFELLFLLIIFLFGVISLSKRKIRKKLKKNKKIILTAFFIIFAGHILDIISTILCINKLGIEVEENVIISFLFGHVGYFSIFLFSVFVVFLIFLYVLFCFIAGNFVFKRKVWIIPFLGAIFLSYLFFKIAINNFGVCQIW